MSQLTFSAIPGFFDLGDGAIAAGQPLTDDSISKISHNAKFGIVRSEEFDMGFYGHGDTVPTPVSPVDGYAYAREECIFKLEFRSSRQPAGGYTPGQASFPVMANSDNGSGNLLCVPYQLYINPSTGLLTVQVYFSSSGAANQGTVKVTCSAQRSSVQDYGGATKV